MWLSSCFIYSSFCFYKVSVILWVWSDSWLFFCGADQRLSRLVHLLTHLVCPFLWLRPISAFLGPLLALEQSFSVTRATRRCPGYCRWARSLIFFWSCCTPARLNYTNVEGAWILVDLTRRCEWQSIQSCFPCWYAMYTLHTVLSWLNNDLSTISKIILPGSWSAGPW